MDRTFSRRIVFALVLGAALCLAAGPAAAQGLGPYQFHSLTPCRVADTRVPAPGSPVADGATRTFVVQGVCGVPVGAKAVTVNLTAVAPNGTGFLTMFPTGITRPVVSSLNFNAGEPALGNGGIVPLADQSAFAQDLSVFARVTGPGVTSVVVDVTGYFQ
jgi:hypothetical protein